MQVIQKFARQIKFLLHRSLIPGSSDPGSGNRLRCSRNTYIKNQRNIRIIGSVSLVLLFTLTAFTLRPVSVSTDFAEATANPATTTLTMTTGYASASLDITPSSTTGTFASSSDDELAKFNVSTNNITGYNLSISHGSSTTPAPLVNEDLSTSSTTVALESLSSGTSITESEFNTSTYVGRYGYRPSKLNSADNSNYIPAPTITATTLNVTSQANTTDTSDNYTIALGANIDYTKSAGTYTNTFILTAVANNVAYTINYLDNTGTGGTTGTDVSNLPATESASEATASSFTLSSTQPTRTGYTFAGWCDGTVTHNATGNDTCSGTTYSAGSAYSFASPSSTSTNVANLYAMWNVKTFAITLDKTNATAIVIDDTSYTGSSATLTYGNHTISGTYDSGYEFDSWSTSNSTNLAITSTSSASTSITVHGAATLTLTGKSSCQTTISGNMQDFNPCSTIATGTTGTLEDSRDNQSYLVGKLADGKWWLLDNLRLGSADFASDVTELNSTNTNTTNSIGTSVFNGWKRTSGFDSYTAPKINTASANKINSDSSENWGNGSHKYGVYYNYCAATMQSYCYAASESTGNASQDVCPKGWRMPTGGSSGEYQALYTAYSSNATNFRNALSTPLSGTFGTDSAGNQGSSGWFWSSTLGTSDLIHYLYVTSSKVTPYNSYYRYFGFSVRCVLKEPIESVTYMQDITSEMVANTSEGATATLRDIRDNQDYTVTKINGNLWMTRNLAIGCNGSGSTYGSKMSSKPLTSADSNVANTSSNPWNTPTSSLTYGDSYTIPRMECSSTYGAWYNYAAASAGTITSGATDASYSICPAGWRLPTYSEFSGIKSYSTAFSPVGGGNYSDGFFNGNGNGNWWSATAYAYDATSRYYLYGSGSLSTSINNRYLGFYVRCIRSS